jgi:uncharacterized protein YraI
MVAATAFGAGAALASPGYVTTSLNLRAGPSTSYPAVVVMHAGDRVEIFGCLSGWSWCDIDWHGYRGWAAGRYLQVLYQQQRRPIVGYGSYFSIPFLSFSIGTYWNQHYRNRNFFKDLPRFEGHPPRNPDFKPPKYNGPPPKKPDFNGKPPIFNGPPPHRGDFKPPKDFKPGDFNKPKDFNPPKDFKRKDFNPPKDFKGPPKFKFNPSNQGSSGKFFKGPPQGGSQGGGGQGGPHCPPGKQFQDGACK